MIESQRVAGTSPSVAIGAFAGTYSDPLRGDVEVSVEGEEAAHQVRHVLGAARTLARTTPSAPAGLPPGAALRSSTSSSTPQLAAPTRSTRSGGRFARRGITGG